MVGRDFASYVLARADFREARFGKCADSIWRATPDDDEHYVYAIAL
jgi:hypothetical protein